MKSDSENKFDARSESERLQSNFKQFVHDFSNSILVIGWLRDRIQNPGTPEVDRGGARKSLQDQEKRALRMVGAFQTAMGFADATPGGERPEVDLVALARAAGRLAWLSPVQHRLHVEFDEPLPYLRADPTLLLRVIENIVANAVKYSPPKSTITLSLRRASGGGTDVRVTDEGNGVPPERRDWIFQREARLPEHRGVPGQGLGLAFCKETINLLGGRVWVESNLPRRGSTFCVWLPPQ